MYLIEHGSQLLEVGGILARKQGTDVPLTCIVIGARHDVL